MKGQLILPPDRIGVKGPVIFLAGPIQGTRDWQSESIKFVRMHAPELNLASPRREYLPKEFVYEKQVDWETYYLHRAAENGVIMFWLAKENEHDCSRAYAQTTRFELAEWKVRHEHDRIKIVVGIEDGFSGAKYIRRRLSQDCPDVKIYDTLKDTCLAAIEKAKEKKKM
jgi:hypothetical protein